MSVKRLPALPAFYGNERFIALFTTAPQPCSEPVESSLHFSLYPSGKSKGKSVPLQARSGPKGSRKLRFPDFVATAQDGGKVVSLTHRPPLPPGNAPGTHFC